MYASALYLDPAATLDDLREAVRYSRTERIARRVLGGAPTRSRILRSSARAKLVPPRPRDAAVPVAVLPIRPRRAP